MWSRLYLLCPIRAAAERVMREEVQRRTSATCFIHRRPPVLRELPFTSSLNIWRYSYGWNSNLRILHFAKHNTVLYGVDLVLYRFFILHWWDIMNWNVLQIRFFEVIQITSYNKSNHSSLRDSNYCKGHRIIRVHFLQRYKTP